jgi:hypothetical protein
MAGRTPQVISEEIANILSGYDTVYDAVGYVTSVGGINMYVVSFPTENVTWAYDIKSDTWSQWSYWNETTAQHEAFMGRFGAYAREWNRYYVQGADSNLYELSRDYHSDDGDVINSSITTGWLDHGTWDRKRCDQLIVKVKCYDNSAESMLLEYRDDGRPEWSNPIVVPLNALNQQDFYAKLNRMGMFRSRQYKFTVTGDVDLALCGMELDITKMRF